VSDEKELEAVVREFDGAMSSANSKAAARLILEARRERDEALARVQELEREKGGATWDCDVLGHAERIAELEAELKSETEEAEGYQKALHAAWAERDGARERTLLECAQHMARVFCEKCAYENNQWLRVALDGDEGLGKERDRLMAERDAAVAEMCSLAKQLGQQKADARIVELEAERDAARAWAQELALHFESCDKPCRHPKAEAVWMDCGRWCPACGAIREYKAGTWGSWRKPTGGAK
jgi:hypothetical protein